MIDKSSSHRLFRARKKTRKGYQGVRASEAGMKDFSFQEHKLVGSQTSWPEVTQMTNYASDAVVTRTR